MFGLRRYFFETLVRVHRQGEGAPYTGLKPADTVLGTPVEAADKALEGGSVERLGELIAGDVRAEIRSRFARVTEARTHADHSVEAGREFVEAYVDYVHYIENIHLLATGKAPAHGGAHSEKSPGAAGQK